MELDDADIAILRAVQEDARRSLRQLAKIAGVSTPTASAKMKMLEEKGVLTGFTAQISTEAVGEHVLMLQVQVRPSNMDEAAAQLAAMPEVRTCYAMSPHQLVAFVTLLDPGLEAEFHTKLGKVPLLESYESALLLRTVKDEPLAVIDRGVALAVRCEFCGRRTKDEVLRVKVGSITHFVCCESCKAGFEERAGRLAAMAGRGGSRGSRNAPAGPAAGAGPGPEPHGHHH